MRTSKDFVKQMFKEKKSPEHIRAVATAGRWGNQMAEIDKWIEIGKKIKIKKSKEIQSKPKGSKKLKIIKRHI